eukprot:gene12546-2289_t
MGARGMLAAALACHVPTCGAIAVILGADPGVFGLGETAPIMERLRDQ